MIMLVEEPKKLIRGTTFYRPELDALRFLAFLMVFTRHAPRMIDFPGSWIVRRSGSYGVCIFFMLSAYLIGELLLREHARTNTVHVASFFVRRALRIWPLYVAAIALGYLLGFVVPEEHIRWQALPYLLLGMGNIWVAKAGWGLGLIVPLWSLSIEEQYYLVIPTLMRLGGRKALMIMSVACIGLAYAALVWFGIRGTDANSVVWVSSFVQFQFFGAGTLLAIKLHAREWILSLGKRLALLSLGLAGFVAAEGLCGLQLVGRSSANRLVGGYGLVLLSCLAVFLAFYNLPLRPPPFIIYLGRISFGLYVFHFFVLVMVPLLSRDGFSSHPIPLTAFCLLLTVGLSSLSFECFEKPILRYKERFTYVKSGGLP